MSLGSRATKGGAKAAGKDKPQDKGKTEKPQPKEKAKPQATTEQLRMAHMIDRKNDDASDVRRMVLQLMETTCRTEEEVCSALHDSDNDVQLACNLLLEESQRIQGEWQTNEKKKKKPPASNNGEAEPAAGNGREARSRSGPRPKRGEGEGARGRGSGRQRGGMRQRGGRRGGPPRPRARHEQNWDHANDNAGTTGDFPATEDWDNEEWSGSLSDTKVFTPSVNAQNIVGEPDSGALNAQGAEDWEAGSSNGPGEHIPTYTYHNPQHKPATAPASASVPAPASAPPINRHQDAHHYLKLNELSSAGAAPAAEPSMEPFHSSHQQHPTHQTHHQPMGMSGTLSAAQTQYLSQFTQQSQRHDNSVYTSNYGVYGSSDISSQRKPQRARVPPPSKIPSSAVEMPGGEGSALFLDVQFGALEPDALQDTQPKQVNSQPETSVTTSHETSSETPSNNYPTTNNMLSESLSVVDTTPTSQPVTSESIVTNSNALEKQLSASMKQMSVSEPAVTPNAAPAAPSPALTSAAASVPAAASAVSAVTTVASASVTHAPQHHVPTNAYSSTQHHRPKQTVSQQQNVYAHHPVSHHPPVYGANVYAPQVNSTNASLTGASAMTATAYPSSVTLTQYQPMMNSYQTSSSATVYGGSALYTAAPYTAYQPTPQPKIQNKDTAQYDSSVASSNSLASTSTTQTSTAKVATTTAGTGVGASASAGSGATTYAAGALYSAGGNTAYAYDEAQILRSTLPHHMGGYYEVGYGVSSVGGVGGVTGVGGVGGAREAGFGLGAGERFGRADAASPQQVPAALPPGYAYFYQPPPTTYQYGVYPYGGGSNVGGVGGVSGGVSGAGKLNTYAPQQPPYDAQDTYKQGGPYTGNASKSAGAAAADITNAMYAKTHVALNKVNSYEKAGFHSGTPPPFGAASHLYIPAPPHHHPHSQHQHQQQHHHQPQQHQMDVRVNSSHNRRGDSGSGGARASAAKPAASKATYNQSYWAPN